MDSPPATPADYAPSRTANLLLNDGLPVLPVQWDVLQCGASVIGCFGSWRSGKTRAASMALLKIACENPWRSIYKVDNPTSVVITETTKVIRDSAYRELMQVLPTECILKKWESPNNWRVRLVNGHDIVFRPWSGALEGLSAIGVWIDEAHKLDSPDGPEALWRNFQMRATDPRASRRLTIATGLPEYGYLSEIFDKPNTAERSTFLCSLRQNFYLATDTIRSLMASTTKEEAAVVIDGKWRKPPTVVYYAFGDLNLTSFRGNVNEPADLSIDLGDKGAMLVTQKCSITCREPDGRGGWKTYRDTGIVVVDELLPEQQSVKDALRDFLKNTPWSVRSSESRIYVDPKVDRDEIDAIRDILGAGKERGPRLIRQKPNEKGYWVEYGQRCVNSAFRDYYENPRLFISEHLPRTQRSLIPSLRKHRRKPNGSPYRDNIVDHILDCLRYVVVDQLPLRERGKVIVNKAA